MRRTIIRAMLLATTLSILIALPSGAQTGEVVTAQTVQAVMHVTPNPIDVTTFFDGTELQISGVAPAGQQLAVLLAGKDSAVELKKKGKVWGLLWMNVGEISFEAVPAVYLLASSTSVAELAPAELRQRLGVGLDVLGANRGAAEDEESVRLFGELVKLKAGERLYGSFENTFEISPDGQGEVQFSTTLPLPSKVPEGSCRVTLWGFHDGSAEQLVSSEITVREVGLTHDIAALARDHGLLYGMLALVIALVAGFATGLIFGLAGKGGH